MSAEWAIFVVVVIFWFKVAQYLRSINRHMLDIKRLMYDQTGRPFDERNSI